MEEDYTKPLSLSQKIVFGVTLPFACVFILAKALVDTLFSFGRRRATHDTQDTWDVVCISHVGWHFIRQRNHHTMSRLAKKRKVLYVHPLRPDHLIRFPSLVRLLHPYKEGGVAIYSPLLIPGQTRLTLIKQLNQWILTAAIRRQCRKLSIRPFILWFYFPMWEYVREPLCPLCTVYDIQDEYAQMSESPEAVQKSELRLLETADIVFTGTKALYEKKKKHTRNIHFIPCGVDYEEFAASYEKRPDDLRDIVSPILGYVGSIHEKKISVGILTHLATIHPEWSVVMIGPVHKDAFPLPLLPNVHLLGSRPYEEVPRYVHHFDVCLMPFERNELTEHINPTKSLEYFAAARPVVSTSIPDMVDLYSDIIFFGDTPEEFTCVCEEALQGNCSGRIEKGKHLAQDYSWEVLMKKMEKKIDELIEGYVRNGESIFK